MFRRLSTHRSPTVMYIPLFFCFGLITSHELISAGPSSSLALEVASVRCITRQGELLKKGIGCGSDRQERAAGREIGNRSGDPPEV